jgi:hypothetical protein
MIISPIECGEADMAIAPIGLADLIVTTAQEIRKARDASAEKGDPVLSLEGCELELKVSVSAEANAGIKVWLLDLSAKGSAERASTITLKFGPAPGGKPEVFFVDRTHRLTSEDDHVVPQRRATRDEVKRARGGSKRG